jgi:hypothetical protein
VSNGVTELTDFGFKFGAAEVLRAAVMPDGAVCIQVETEAGKSVDVYVSRAGRSIRVFSQGKEWKPCPD